MSYNVLSGTLNIAQSVKPVLFLAGLVLILVFVTCCLKMNGGHAFAFMLS